ncbi:MAG: hypothetical protein EOO09_18835 [Chitinophagaceae bacterium]|nr:MAG: hypothetical protein EOO09_18835 [Chitinophagaceae bacterium]
MTTLRYALAGLLATGTLFAEAQGKTGAIKVEMRKTDSTWQVIRDGKPYFIKGTGGPAYPARTKAYGGNSIRTWSTRGAEKVLDSAAKYGFTVLLGLDVARERHGFNYDDPAAVEKQLAELKKEVLKYKDHPNVLAWGIGNELNLHYSNPKVWDAVNEISKMCHELDKNHPTSTELAGISKAMVDEITKRAPDLDLLGINTYAPLSVLPAEVKKSGWDKAYMVTEWGPTGHWETLETAWKQPIEETSSEKANVYKSRYEFGIERDPQHCVGSYVFLWGQKQERTPTWYGVFTDKGEESEVVDVLQYLWSGTWPANRAPHIYSLQVDGKKAIQNVYTKAGSTYDVLAVATDPDNDKLGYRWDVLPEPTKVGDGGDHEDRPASVSGLITGTSPGKAKLKAPSKPGAYRLFVYITDGKNNVATANIPFYVN